MRYRKGSKVKMSEDALENYGQQYRNKVFTVTHAANKYMPAKEFYEKGKPEGFHPGYDGNGSMGLYDFEELNFSLYDWELKGA